MEKRPAMMPDEYINGKPWYCAHCGEKVGVIDDDSAPCARCGCGLVALCEPDQLLINPCYSCVPNTCRRDREAMGREGIELMKKYREEASSGNKNSLG